jgi:acetyl esterase
MSHILQKVAPIGESRDKELLKSASSYAYASHDGTDLLGHAFFPETEGTGRPAVAFFHGGFWDTPMVTQFVPHCHHFAGRGAVAITFEYRTGSRHGTGPLEAIADATAAFLWLQENAELLGIDPEKIVVGGAAGGAFLALQLAMRKPRKNAAESPRPAAAILFSSLLNTTPKGQLCERFPDKKAAKTHSPTSLLRRKLPPMLFLHGKADRVTPFEEVSSFHRRMKWRGNRSKLLDFTAAEHSFFNFNVSHTNFEMTIAAADSFLVKEGVIPPLAEESE